MVEDNLRNYCHFVEKACEATKGEKAEQGLFFAYPSDPETSADAIRGAVKKLQESSFLNMKTIDWVDLPVEGNIILCEICKAIKSVSCVVLNTTLVNFNVLFEYGLAIGLGKAIWPLVEKGISKDELVCSNVKSITTIGYSQFTNSNSIYKKLLKKSPWERISHFELPERLGNEPSREAMGFLYIKDPQDNEPSFRISESLSSVPFELITDDPNEVPFRHIGWYLNNIRKAFAVIIHLGSERMLGVELHRAKCALIAGIALALGRRLLLLGENVTIEPIDYRDLIRSYKNANEAETIVKQFIENVQPQLTKYQDYTSKDILSDKEKKKSLLDFDIGDYVAENEQVSLENYFVDTPEFLKAMETKCNIFVGRKGSGKTANFLMIASRILESDNCLVCAIKPKEYQLNELVDFVSHELNSVKKGYLLESFWKFMLYSEGLANIRDRIINNKDILEPIETRILGYLEGNKFGTNESFTSRLVNIVRALYKTSVKDENAEVAISEILHVREIKEISKLIYEYIEIKRIRQVAILVDGLDANWRLGENHEIISDILLALIGATSDIWRDCNKRLGNANFWKGMTIDTFIRSDVFTAMIERARDPDKLHYEILNWPDADSIIKILNRRILANTGRDEEVLNWEAILDPGFDYEEMKVFLNNNILPRPRDYIYYFQRVLYYTNLRKTKYITKRDFQSAQAEYSQWILLSLSGESQHYIPNMFDLLLEFDKRKRVLGIEEINAILIKAGIKEEDLTKTVQFLIDVNFLGYGIDANNFRFPTSPQEDTIMKRRFLRHIRGDYRKAQFKIHNAFHIVLSIQ